jgi:hypothetical protein
MGWHVAALSTDRRSLEPPQLIGVPKASFLTIAATGDGMLATAFTTDVPVDTVVPPTVASAVYLPASGAAEPPIDVMFGARRVGFAPFPLVAPGYAAVLVIKQGTYDPDGELVVLRTPCGR